MKCFTREIMISSAKSKEVIDITDRVAGAIADSGISNGICIVHTSHTTSAMLVNENEDGLKQDIMDKVAEEFPDGHPWRHNRIDSNAAAHIAASFIGNSVAIPIRDGKPCLGTWQSVLFLELDGPRPSRKVTVQAIGEA